MSNLDNIEFEILADGTVKFTTDAVSAPNHASAEEFLRIIQRLSGGETVRTRRSDAVHTHDDHVHGKHEHKH